MKINEMKKLSIKNLLVFTFVLFLSSCLQNQIDDIKNTTNNDNINSAGFDFKTIKEYNVNITTLNNANQVISGVVIELYSKNPINESTVISQ